MSVFGLIALIAALIIGMGTLLWYLLIITEGVYLGRRVVVWLYDVYARRYDNIKKFDPEWEGITLAEPFLNALREVEHPLILDVATGTARLPLALIAESKFQGHIIGLDFSRRMLTVAAEKLASVGGEAPTTLIYQTAEALPFADATFDAVTCLEALEFMPNQNCVLGEIVRVLRPGGLLLLTNRKGSGAREMPFKTQSVNRLMNRLRARFGLVDVSTEIWQVDYQQVWAFKPGDLEPALSDLHTCQPESLMRCPQCGKTGFRRAERELRCPHCGGVLPIGADQVIDYAKA